MDESLSFNGPGSGCIFQEKGFLAQQIHVLQSSSHDGPKPNSSLSTQHLFHYPWFVYGRQRGLSWRIREIGYLVS